VTPAEARLQTALAHIQAIADAPLYTAGAVSYSGWPGDLAASWAGAVSRLRESLARCIGAIAETRPVEDANAISVSSRLGDLETVWAGAPRVDEQRAHFAAVEARLRERARMVAIVLAAVRAAATLASLAASPMLAPAALSSLLNLVAELQKI